jgi:hypothetical protein
MVQILQSKLFEFQRPLLKWDKVLSHIILVKTQIENFEFKIAISSE